MKSFEFTLTDPMGLHARPTGILIKEVRQYKSKVTIRHKDKEVDASRLMAMMALGARCGDTISLTIEGEDEEAAAAGLQSFMQEKLR